MTTTLFSAIIGFMGICRGTDKKQQVSVFLRTRSYLRERIERKGYVFPEFHAFPF